MSWFSEPSWRFPLGLNVLNLWYLLCKPLTLSVSHVFKEKLHIMQATLNVCRLWFLPFLHMHLVSPPSISTGASPGSKYVFYGSCLFIVNAHYCNACKITANISAVLHTRSEMWVYLPCHFHDFSPACTFANIYNVHFTLTNSYHRQHFCSLISKQLRRKRTTYQLKVAFLRITMYESVTWFGLQLHKQPVQSPSLGNILLFQELFNLNTHILVWRYSVTSKVQMSFIQSWPSFIQFVLNNFIYCFLCHCYMF